MGLTGFDCGRDLLACVIQCPQSDIQRETINVDSDIVAEASNLDAEYEALVASSLVVA